MSPASVSLVGKDEVPLVAPVDEIIELKEPVTVAAPKKNKKKSKKKTTDEVVLEYHSIPAQDNSVFRLVKDWPANMHSVQSSPPSVKIHNYFPMGEIIEYSNYSAAASEAASAKDELMEDDLKNIRRAAEVHRNVRKYAQSFIRPGLTMVDICTRLEKKTLELVGTLPDWSNYLDCGYGFPTGCSINHVAAHYSPNYGDKTKLTANDICKLDFGVQVAGRIVDCAFTVAFDPIFDPLIQSTQEATNAGLRAAGIDARLGEIGAIIQETIESFEFTDKAGKTVPIKPCRNLNGHSMEPYHIHAGQSIPIVAQSEFANDKMREGVFYAIETFASTGKGYVVEDGECSHYMRSMDGVQEGSLRHKGAKPLLQAIDKQFGTLPFCRRWLDDMGQPRHLLALKSLVESGLVQDYPPLVDVKGSFTSQMEHTIVLRPTCKEVVSRGDDF